MDDTQSDAAGFDAALIRMAMIQADARGWNRVTVAEAAREAGLQLDRARERFPTRNFILVRLGQQFDRAALADAVTTGTARERLFDLLMRRLDALQLHRAGIRSLLRALPLDPAAALLLMAETRLSMGWMAQAAGIDSTGVRGGLVTTGLVGVWLVALRAWERDDSVDLSATMAALDRALDRAGSIASRLGGIGEDSAGSSPDPTAEPLGESFTTAPSSDG